LKVLSRLSYAKHDAFIVGGGVRDLLLGIIPKDFDIATDAKPNQVKDLFRNCRLIGKRFRLAHVHFGREILEVATFRGSEGNKETQQTHASGMIKRDNAYGTFEEDVWRRDITINALYYNIKDFSIVDLVGGMQDIKDKIIRIMGKPEKRYTEDPVRMLRVVRLAAKLNFTIEEKTLAPLPKMAELLDQVSNARLFDECVKLFHAGAALRTINLLHEQSLLRPIFPQTVEAIANNEKAFLFIKAACKNTDDRIHAGKTVTPAFLFAVLLWHPLCDKMEQLIGEGMPPAQARLLATSNVLSDQMQYTAVPKRFTMAIRDIWQLQHRLTHKIDKRTFSLPAHPRFRAAYDFLLLRAEIDAQYHEKSVWWTEFQAADPVAQTQMFAEAAEENKKQPQKKRRKKKPKKTNDDQPPKSADGNQMPKNSDGS
jgi:poly(A) polymerase